MKKKRKKLSLIIRKIKKNCSFTSLCEKNTRKFGNFQFLEI